jgi:hypothetical protein
MSTMLEHLIRHVLYHVGREVGGYLSRTPDEPSEEQPPRGESPSRCIEVKSRSKTCGRTTSI